MVEKGDCHKTVGMLDKAIPAVYGMNAFREPVDWLGMAYYKLGEKNNNETQYNLRPVGDDADLFCKACPCRTGHES